VHFKITQREGKAVIYADQRGWPIAERFHQPGSDALPGPVFARAGWRGHFNRRRIAFGLIDAQTLQAGNGDFRARVIYADGASEKQLSVLR
jgi:hypothetical protein